MVGQLNASGDLLTGNGWDALQQARNQPQFVTII
jgi:hypothetical protein